MASNKILYFEGIDPANLEDSSYYDTQIPIDGKECNLDINYESKSFSQKTVETINKFTSQLQAIHKKNLQRIKEDLNSGSEVKKYLECQMNLLDDPEFRKSNHSDSKTQSPKEQFLSLLHLHSIGLYPEEEDYFARFDYSLDINFTDQ